MKKLKYILLSLILLAIFVFVYIFTYKMAEPRVYDYMVRNVMTEKLPFDNHKQVYGSEDVVLVIIDDKTAQKYRYPWKRITWTKLLPYFYDYAKPKVVIHDAIILTPDTENPESDRAFFNMIKKFNNLVQGFCPKRYQSWENQKAGFEYDKKFVAKYGINITDATNADYTPYLSMLVMPDICFNSLKYSGSVNMVPGYIDGTWSSLAGEIYRTQEYIIKYSDGFLPSLAMRAFLVANNNPEVVLTKEHIIIPKLNQKVNYTYHNGRYVVPVRFYKLYDNDYSHIKYSALDVMESLEALKQGKKPMISPEVFKDKIVIVGANSTATEGLNDNKNSPMTNKHPGADYQATAIDNIIHNDFLTIIPNYINIIVALLGMALVYLSIRKYDLLPSVVAALLIIAVFLLICTGCFYYKVILNVITPLVMWLMTLIVAYSHKYLIENTKKEKVKSAMGKYMSEDVMKNVVKNIDNLGLGGKKATATVLFADIRGFTSISEKMSAQQVSEILNEYFNEMEPIITSYNGIINKFIGDAIMAIFGEPIQDKEHAQNAVKCGYAMLQRVENLQKKWSREGKPKIEIGVGINTGEVFVGNIGSVNRMEYTVIGDTVNLASRLESYNKVYKSKMLISKATYNKVKSFVDVLKISDVQIRGKANKMDIFEILGVREDNN